MIASLSGKLLRRTADAVIIDVAGVGYQVAVPLSTASVLPADGSPVFLQIYTHLREDALSLYGFATDIEKELFLVLIGVTGIGPKLALAVLSGLSVDEIVAAIGSGDDAKLCAIPGVGKKTAARMCLEIKDKVRLLQPGGSPSRMAGAAAGPAEDAVSALMNLGYRRSQAEDAVRTAVQGQTQMGIEETLRRALNVLTTRPSNV